MRIADIPNKALDSPPTPIPMRVIYDWDKLFEILKTEGFVIIESTTLRKTKAGVDEAVEVKAFNSHVRTTRKLKLYTKRISATRWFCTL